MDATEFTEKGQGAKCATEWAGRGEGETVAFLVAKLSYVPDTYEYLSAKVAAFEHLDALVIEALDPAERDAFLARAADGYLGMHDSARDLRTNIAVKPRTSFTAYDLERIARAEV